MGAHFQQLLLHSEVRWLSWCKVLARLCDLREEVFLFLTEINFELAKHLADMNWLIYQTSSIGSALSTPLSRAKSATCFWHMTSVWVQEKAGLVVCSCWKRFGGNVPNPRGCCGEDGAASRLCLTGHHCAFEWVAWPVWWVFWRGRNGKSVGEKSVLFLCHTLWWTEPAGGRGPGRAQLNYDEFLVVCGEPVLPDLHAGYKGPYPLHLYLLVWVWVFCTDPH